MRILIVDDDPVVAQALAEPLIDDGYSTLCLTKVEDALSELEAVNASDGEHAADQEPIGIALIDLNLPDRPGMDLLRAMHKQFNAVRPIVVTGFGKIESAVEAMQLGAVDYLTKPVMADDLRKAVTMAANQHALMSESATSTDEPSQRTGLTSLVGTDVRMQKVYDLIEAVAPSRTTVLITGSSGTGKTMAARAIHTLSPRAKSQPAAEGSQSSEKSSASSKTSRKNGKAKNANHKPIEAQQNSQGGPFVTFSCGAIPEALAESELFGHVRGAFTGADYDKPGKILTADGGTLFIDEINSASPALQMKLLRVLQERTFEPVGSTQTKEADVRFVLATNASLAEMVREGTFREDLYYRINVVNIHMPALDERTGDIAVLAEHFLERYCAELQRTRHLSDAARTALQTYAWPGNVRELENAIERAVVLSRGPVIDLEDLPELVAATVDRRYADDLIDMNPPGGTANDTAFTKQNAMGSDPRKVNAHHSQTITIPALANGWTPTALDRAMEPCERQILLAALQANTWNRQETSSQLGINRTTLYKKIRHHRLDEPVR